MSKKETFFTYAVCAITGAMVGVAVGGKMISSFGGFNTISSLFAIATLGFLCIVVSALIPFTIDKYQIRVLLWLLLFFGAAILPGLSGI